LTRPGIRNSYGAFFMQFALPAIVEQTECRVAALLNLGKDDTSANGVDRAGRDEDDVALHGRAPLSRTGNRTVPDRRAQFLWRETSFQSNGNPRAGRCREDIPCFGLAVPPHEREGESSISIE